MKKIIFLSFLGILNQFSMASDPKVIPVSVKVATSLVKNFSVLKPSEKDEALQSIIEILKRYPQKDMPTLASALAKNKGDLKGILSFLNNDDVTAEELSEVILGGGGGEDGPDEEQGW